MENNKYEIVDITGDRVSCCISNPIINGEVIKDIILSFYCKVDVTWKWEKGSGDGIITPIEPGGWECNTFCYDFSKAMDEGCEPIICYPDFHIDTTNVCTMVSTKISEMGYDGWRTYKHAI